jgi:hypothetical protein
MQRFMNAQVSAKALLNHDAMTTWFSDWQVAHGRVSLLQIRVIINNVKIAIDELGYIEKCINQVLGNVYDKNTVEEWLGTYLDPVMKQLCECRDRGNRCLEQQNPVTLMASSNILAGNSNQQNINPDEIMAGNSNLQNNLPNSAVPPPLPLPVTYGPPAYDPMFDYQDSGYNAY